MIRRPPRSTPKPSSAASDVYKRQGELSIYDLSGKKVFNREVGGSGQVKWNAADLPSGVYLIKLTSRNNEVTRKITLLK